MGHFISFFILIPRTRYNVYIEIQLLLFFLLLFIFCCVNHNKNKFIVFSFWSSETASESEMAEEKIDGRKENTITLFCEVITSSDKESCESSRNLQWGQGRYAQMDGWGKFAGFFFQMRRDGMFKQSNRTAAGGVK